MSRETVYLGKLIQLVVDDGYEVVLHPPAVAVVAVDEEEKVTLVRQARPAIGGVALELPAGLLDAGESPLECAQREVQEETGLYGGEWQEAACVYTSPGFTDERLHLFIGTGLKRGRPSPEETEDIELVQVAVDELPALLPELNDAKTLAGILLFLRNQLPG
jgi:ADP-ribose pyrophosphatase